MIDYSIQNKITGNRKQLNDHLYEMELALI